MYTKKITLLLALAAVSANPKSSFATKAPSKEQSKTTKVQTNKKIGGEFSMQYNTAMMGGLSLLGLVFDALALSNIKGYSKLEGLKWLFATVFIGLLIGGIIAFIENVTAYDENDEERMDPIEIVARSFMYGSVLIMGILVNQNVGVDETNNKFEIFTEKLSFGFNPGDANFAQKVFLVYGAAKAIVLVIVNAGFGALISLILDTSEEAPKKAKK